MNKLKKDLLKQVIKIVVFGLLDAWAVWGAVSLFTQHLYKLLVILIIGTVLINIVYLQKRTYPLKYILPGTLFMLILIVYPLIYTFYVSLTNYGTGHILNKEQVIDQLEDRYFLPEDSNTFSFQVFTDQKNNLILLFRDETGNLLLGKEEEIIDISAELNDLTDKNVDDILKKYGNFNEMPKKYIFKNLAELQKLEFDYNNKIIKMKNFSQFAQYIPQYKYNSEEDLILDLQNKIEYYPEKGYFTSRAGEKLLPGFRVYLGWENFQRILNDDRIAKPFIRVLVWTLIWATLSVLTTFVLGLLLALLLNDRYLKFKKLYRILLILPYAIPAFISAMVWHGLFDTEVGVINEILKYLFGSGIPWLIDPFWAKVALLIVNLWLGFPYMMIICLGALQSIPDSYYEAAAIDGASLWQQFKNITFPLLLVSIGPLLISSFAFNFNNFSVIYLFNKGRPAIPNAQTPAGATDILISYTYRLSFESGRGADFGLASAVTIIIFVITVLITWFNFRFTGALEEVKENV